MEIDTVSYSVRDLLEAYMEFESVHKADILYFLANLTGYSEEVLEDIMGQMFTRDETEKMEEGR